MFELLQSSIHFWCLDFLWKHKVGHFSMWRKIGHVIKGYSHLFSLLVPSMQEKKWNNLSPNSSTDTRLSVTLWHPTLINTHRIKINSVEEKVNLVLSYRRPLVRGWFSNSQILSLLWHRCAPQLSFVPVCGHVCLCVRWLSSPMRWWTHVTHTPVTYKTVRQTSQHWPPSSLGSLDALHTTRLAR